MRKALQRLLIKAFYFFVRLTMVASQYMEWAVRLLSSAIYWAQNAIDWLA